MKVLEPNSLIKAIIEMRQVV